MLSLKGQRTPASSKKGGYDETLPEEKKHALQTYRESRPASIFLIDLNIYTVINHRRHETSYTSRVVSSWLAQT
jgi:hypothetical protein